MSCGNCSKPVMRDWLCCPHCTKSLQEHTDSDLASESDDLVDHQIAVSDDSVIQNSSPEDHDVDWKRILGGTQTYINSLEDVFQRTGIHGLGKTLERQMDCWKDIQLNIGVVGGSGTGKSSFINAIRGLRTCQKGAIQVGVVETTTRIRPYPHPKWQNLKFWDVPGVGTPDFPKETYLNTINFKDYDFFILVTANRFMEGDAWLAKEMLSLGKKLYFVRTKIDQDVANETRPAEDVIELIKNNCKQHLNKCGVNSPLIFLVNNNDPTLYEFGHLVEKLVNDAPALKKKLLVLAVSAMTETVFEEKRQLLDERIKEVALLSAIRGGDAVEGIEIAVSADLLINEAQLYAEQFGIDTTVSTTKSSFLEYCATESRPYRFRLPILGTMLGTLLSPISYIVTAFILTRILKKTVTEARKTIRNVLSTNV